MYRRFGDGQPAAWEGPGWYREDSGPAPSGPASSPPDRTGRPQAAPSSPRPGPPGWTDPFSAVPMSGPRPAGPGDQRGNASDRGPGRRPEPSRTPPAGRDRPDDDEPGASPARTWRWGRMSGLQGTGILVVAAALGALVTVATKHDPGPLLGGFVVAGTLAAGFAVRPRSAYALIPLPVLCYLIFALAAGLGREELNSSTSGLTVDAAQWIANGFLTMAGATVLAILITLGRWLWARHTSPAEARQAPEPRMARLAAETRARPADEPARPDQAGRLRGGTPPEPSFRPDPSWTDDRQRGPAGPLDQGARWAQQDESGGRGRRDERGPGGRDGGQDRVQPGRDEPGRGGQADDFWDRDAPDRRWRRTGREPGDQGQGDWRRRPPSGPPSFGSRDLASGA